MIQQTTKRPAPQRIKTRKRPRVFALEPCGKLNVTDAERYGAIWYLYLEAKQRPAIWDEAFSRAVLVALTSNDYNPAIDYVLVAGAMVNVALVVATVAAEYGRINLLCWCAAESRYVARGIGSIEP